MDKSTIKNILKGLSATTIGTITSMAFHFVSIYFLTRYLSIGDFGIYALIIAISGLLNLISGLGLEISIVKYISDDSGMRQKVLYPALVLKVISTVCVSFLFLFFYKLYPVGDDVKIWNYNLFIIVLFILGSFRDFFYRVLQGLGSFKSYTNVQILTAVTRVILIILFIYYYELSLLNLLYIESITTFMAVFIQFIFIPFKSLIQNSREPGLIKQMLKFSSPLYANNLITFAYDRIGLFIIGILLNTTSVAIYDVSTRLPGALQGLFNSFIIVFFPNISTLFSKNDKENAGKLMNHSLHLTSLILSSLALLIILWKDPITKVLFSENYLASAIPLALLMISFIMRALSNILGYSIVSAGFSKIPMKVNVISMLLGISSSIVLVWQLGYLGAALSVIILNGVSLMQYSFYVKKLNLAVLETVYLKPFITLICISVLLLSFEINSVIVNLLSIALFLLVNGKSFLLYKNHFLTLIGKPTLQ